MERESRSDKMYRQLNEFLEDKSAETRNTVLYKSEVKKLEKHLNERAIPVSIIEKKDLKGGRVRITLQKL